MSVVIKACETVGDLKKFVQLPYELYKSNAYWVPPMKADELKSLQYATNPAYENCEAKFWIAVKGNKVVGRVGAIINHAANEKIGEKMCRISRVEFIDDKDISKNLLATAEKCARE